MLRTLFLIPHEIASIPVFGLGWGLAILVAVLMIRLAWAKRKHDLYEGPDEGAPPTVGQVISAEGLVWAIGAILMVFVLPNVEVKNIAGERIGMAVRGYGVMLVFGIASAVALAAYRAPRYGMDPELIYGLAPVLLISGIVGARLFFVIQYFDQFQAETLGRTIANMLAFTEGGLVVYGSFIGGFIAFVVFSLRNKINVLRFGDVIIPAVFLGMFFGRIGCLMNGCCYGGRCEDGWAAIEFPPATAVYEQQLSNGELLGMRIDRDSGKVLDVLAGSLAADRGIESGDLFEAGAFAERTELNSRMDLPEEDVQPGWVMRVSGELYRFTADQLPGRALPVRAAQPISSACGLALCLLLCLLSKFLHRDGALLAIGFGGYAITRFGLEIVRVDEGGQFDTELSISQWVSVVVLSLCAAALIWIYSRPLSSFAPRTNDDQR